ncbi:hypothetical protein OGAPHI_002494 [Ogataea philodendri]|uniref:Secreted protein n=1 Tax=Ogataea philodendri TaxID=1378263 RepID=A0A9P8PC34_9ASCO|nr:uncharacterized protein OGAPHI_002494 [Ogataea philodendri]KAH3668739.1 hypothetical protein OGAPHI_002494 [Ogataea philodendri]
MQLIYYAVLLVCRIWLFGRADRDIVERVAQWRHKVAKVVLVLVVVRGECLGARVSGGDGALVGRRDGFCSVVHALAHLVGHAAAVGEEVCEHAAQVVHHAGVLAHFVVNMERFPEIVVEKRLVRFVGKNDHPERGRGDEGGRGRVERLVVFQLLGGVVVQVDQRRLWVRLLLGVLESQLEEVRARRQVPLALLVAPLLVVEPHLLRQLDLVVVGGDALFLQNALALDDLLGDLRLNRLVGHVVEQIPVAPRAGDVDEVLGQLQHGLVVDFARAVVVQRNEVRQRVHDVSVDEPVDPQHKRLQIQRVLALGPVVKQPAQEPVVASVCVELGPVHQLSHELAKRGKVHRQVRAANCRPAIRNQHVVVTIVNVGQLVLAQVGRLGQVSHGRPLDKDLNPVEHLVLVACTELRNHLVVDHSKLPERNLPQVVEFGAQSVLVEDGRLCFVEREEKLLEHRQTLTIVLAPQQSLAVDLQNGQPHLEQRLGPVQKQHVHHTERKHKRHRVEEKR